MGRRLRKVAEFQGMSKQPTPGNLLSELLRNRRLNVLLEGRHLYCS